MFLEYLRIPKKAKFNVEIEHFAADSAEHVDAARIMPDGPAELRLFDGKWTMRYSKHSDFVTEHLLHFLVGDRWETAMNGAAESGRLRTEWTREWVEGHKGQSMEEALSEFVDERLLRILRIKTVLRTGKGAEDKRPFQNESRNDTICNLGISG